ncbi:MAG: hypothetical protein FJ295_11930 [Planctomycetes bacterium]|nr:hypothetical protein [Planctomycetota bacterium]
MRFVALLTLSFLPISSLPATAAESDAQERASKVIEAAGGESQLLDLFRFRERVLITDTPAPPVVKDEKENRTSVVRVGGDWWVGSDKRDKDKVRVLCWAWSLRILRDSKSILQTIPDIKVADQPAFGLRVTGSVKDPIDLYFDHETKRLAAIDYDDTRHIFSDWKKSEDGRHYPSHVAGFRFENRAAGTLKSRQWYQTDILELTLLKELPSELKR